VILPPANLKADMVVVLRFFSSLLKGATMLADFICDEIEELFLDDSRPHAERMADIRKIAAVAASIAKHDFVFDRDELELV
jgi:hypothetical protein